jgi:hypothetical protein
MSDDDEEKRRDQEVRERKAEGVWEERPGYVAKTLVQAIQNLVSRFPWFRHDLNKS